MKTAIAIAALLAALGVVGAMDAEDGALYDAHKCDMVASGAWPKSVLNGVECK